jgi:hypothetical protein
MRERTFEEALSNGCATPGIAVASGSPKLRQHDVSCAHWIWRRFDAA